MTLNVRNLTMATAVALVAGTGSAQADTLQDAFYRHL